MRSVVFAIADTARAVRGKRAHINPASHGRDDRVGSERVEASCVVTKRALVLACLAASCATTEPPKAPEPRVDVVELFRRARFKELSELDTGAAIRWVTRIRARQIADGEDVADTTARVAYRLGDAPAAKEAVNALSASNRTRKIISALLENVDATKHLRETVGEHPGRVQLPLLKPALALGLPVIEIELKGRRFRMLWDTGASENVLSPKAVDELDLVRTAVQFPVLRDVDGYVVRFAATGTEELRIGPEWTLKNVPWLVADLSTVADLLNRATTGLDGFLSPQLVIPQGCFTVDKARAVLDVGFDKRTCGQMLAGLSHRTPVFTWNGLVYASVKIHQSPDVAVQLETGSPISFLRSDATRYLPRGTINAPGPDDEIAHDLSSTVDFHVAGRERAISAIDLQPRRVTDGHDDLATLGTDILLEGSSMIVSFATMELGLTDGRVANARGVTSVENEHKQER
jgi:hypothetical protein